MLPESVVWLYSNSRVEEAERIIRNAAKLNNIAMPHSILAPRSLEIIVPPIKSAAATSNAVNGVTVQKVDNGAVLSNLERFKRAKVKAASIQKTRYTLIDLFRSFRLAVYCVSMSFLWSVAHCSTCIKCLFRSVTDLMSPPIIIILFFFFLLGDRLQKMPKAPSFQIVSE